MNSKSKKVSAIIGASLLVAGSGVAYMISYDSSDTNKASDGHAIGEDSSQKSISSLKIKTYSNIDAQKPNLMKNLDDLSGVLTTDISAVTKQHVSL